MNSIYLLQLTASAVKKFFCKPIQMLLLLSLLVCVSLYSCGTIFFGANHTIKWYSGGQLELAQVAATKLRLTGSLKVQAMKVGGLPVLPDGVEPSQLAGGSVYDHAAVVAWFVKLQSEYSGASMTRLLTYIHTLPLLPVNAAYDGGVWI
jgi:hypothetical protein